MTLLYSTGSQNDNENGQCIISKQAQGFQATVYSSSAIHRP